MKKVSSLLFSVLFLTTFVQAQDIHLSQFNAAPILLNAANTGNFDGQFRVTTNYRNQWAAVSAPYATGIVSADFTLLKKKKNFFGVGLSGIYDKSGTGELTNRTIYGSAAYHIHIGKSNKPKHYIHIGIQGGYVNRTININKLIFASQYNPTTHTFKLISIESFNNNNKSKYYDLNAGAVWTSTFSKKFSLQGGVNFMHINNPKELNLVINSTSISIAATVIHALAQVNLNDKVSLSPTILLMNYPTSSELTFGSSLNYLLDNFTIYCGAYYRTNDAVIGLLGLQFKKIRLGFSYDINVSPLHVATNYKGAFELSLAYCPYHSDKKIKFYPKD